MGAVVAPQPKAALGPPVAVAPLARAMLVGVSPHVRSVLAPVLRDAGYDVVDAPGGARVDQASVVAVEVRSSAELVRAVPGLRRTFGRPYVIAVTGWWNENECELQRAADAVVHAPVRERECRVALRAIVADNGRSLLSARALAN